jgi:signal recognition particle subunit SRP54
MLDKMPGMNKLPPSAQASLDSGLFKTMAVIIDSMTNQEKQYPDLISGSRKQRIAKGSGKQVQDVNRLMKQFKQAQKMMKKVSKKGGMQKMMRGLNNLQSPPFQKRR